MQNSCNRCLFIILALTTILSAQTLEPVAENTPLSFRSQALGGTILDDLDLVYDPIELRFVDGYRLYTNLSNLTSTREELFNGLSDNEFLLGFSGRNLWVRNLWTSILVRYRNARTSNTLLVDRDLDGLADIFQQGQFRDIFTAFLDTDGNGLFDIKRVIDQEKRNFSRNRNTFVSLNNTVLLRDAWTLGLKATYGVSSTENTTSAFNLGSGFGPLLGAPFGSPSFNLNFDLFAVDNNFLNFNQNESGEFLTRLKEDFLQFDMAVMRPMEIMPERIIEFRADLGFRQIDSRQDSDNFYGGSFDNFDPASPAFQDRFLERVSQVNDLHQSGTGLSLAFSARQVLQKGEERKDDAFWRAQIGIDRYSFDYEVRNLRNLTTQDIFNDTSLPTPVSSSDNLSLQERSTDIGDGSSLRIKLAGLVNIPLDDNISLGIGVQFSNADLERNTRQMESLENVLSIQVADTFTTNDQDIFSTQGIDATRTYERTDRIFSFPVGIEYRFTRSQKWRFRVGSIFTYTEFTESDARDISDARPLVVTTTSGDGSVQTQFFDNTYESTSSFRKNAVSITSFVYGLGYQPTEHLQIDLLGFLGNTSDQEILTSDFLKQLRLSFSLRF